MAESSARSRLKVVIGADADGAKTALIDLSNAFRDVRNSAKEGFALPNLKLIETQVKAGLRPLQDLKRALAETIGQAKLADKIDPNPINKQRIADAVIQLKALNAELKNTGTEAETFQTKVGKIGAALQQAFLPLAGISASITALLGASANEFKSFEKTLNTIAGVGQLTADELARVKEQSLALGQSTVFSSQQVAESFLELSRAGFTANEATEALPKLLDLAAAAGGDLAVATQAVSEGMRAFGIETSRTGEFTDVLAQAANKSSADIGDLAEAFKQVAPVARQTGQSVQDVSALLAILADNAVKGGDAGSDLRNIITRLVSPSKETSAALKELNVSLKDQQGNVKPLSQFFKELSASLGQYNESSKAALASNLAGQENLKTLLILAGQTPEAIDKMVASMNEADGATKRLADTINQGLFSSLEQLNGSFDTLKSTLGEALSPAIQAVAKLLTNLNQALSQNRVLAQFAAGFLAAVAAVTALGAAFSALLLAFGPLTLALGALGVSLTGAIGGLVAFAAIAGTVTVALNLLGDSANKTLTPFRDFERQLDRTADGIVKEGREALKTAKSFDELAKKTNKTQAEKDQLRKTVEALGVKFPSIIGQIDQLTGGYRSLSDAIRNATAQKLAFAERESIDKELESVRKAQREIAGGFSFNRDARGAKILSDAESKQLKAQQDREKDLLKRRDNIANTVRDKLKELYATPIANPNADNGKNFTAEDAKQEANKIGQAREDLKQKLAQIETEITGFTKGEFEKRRAEAERNFQEDSARIQKLGKEGQLAQSEISEGITRAAELRDRRLAQIAKEETQAVNDAKRFVKELQANVQALNAAITISNPFDDITADAEKATEAISKEYNLAVRSLQEAVQKNPKLADVANQTKVLLEQQFQAALEQQRIFGQQRKFEAERSLRDLQQQNRQLVAEAAGDTLAIEKANNARILADLELRIENQKQILKGAQKALELNPDNKDLISGKDQALAELQNLQAQFLKQSQDSAKKQASIETQGIQTVVQALEQKLELEGRSPRIIAQIVAAYDLLLDQLEKEKNLTSQSAENRAQIQATIEQSRFAQAGLRAETNNFGKALNALSQFDFGNSGFGQFFSQMIGGLENVNTAFEAFKGKPENAGKGFLNFFKSAEGFNTRQFALIAGSRAIQALGQEIGKGKQNLATAFTSVLSDAFSGGATGGPIGAAIGVALGSASRALSSKGNLGQKYLRFIDPLGFRKLFGIDTGKAERERQRQQKIADELVAKALNGADQNNIQDLQARLSRLLRNNKGLTGSRVKQIRDASLQLRAAIAERQKVLNEAIRDLNLQNKALDLALKQTDDQPIKNIGLEQQINLAQVEEETRKALENFKDSAEVMAAVQKNAELKRQAILKGAAQDTIDAIISQQNQIRELRAQAAVSEAEATGNSIALINARLQAELVRLDNEVVAFKGAEETKTELLKANAAERDRLIKASQKQIDDLLRGGLDILNEGLVAGETKFDSQSRRLKELFGSNLNIGGLIQANGSLLQRDIVIGSGGIQFILEGVSDAQSLLSQLSDPAIQAKLLDLLNTAVARA